MRGLTFLAIVTLGLMTSPTFGQDPPVITYESNDSKAQVDVSGKGAVLCLWYIYLLLEAATDVCEWDPLPVDDAISRGIDRIDQFIVANSSQPVTLEMLSQAKIRQIEESLGTSPNETARACTFQAGDTSSFVGGLFEMRRSLTPEQFDASIDAMLSIPREPVMNPCL